MDNDTFDKLNGLTEKWLFEANKTCDELPFSVLKSELRRVKIKILLKCASDLNHILQVIVDKEK